MAKRQIDAPETKGGNRNVTLGSIVAAKGDLVFISGMVPRDQDGNTVGVGDVQAQARHVCDQIKTAVEAAGGTIDDICRIDVFLRDMKDTKKVYEVRQEYFKPPLPASTMVAISDMTSPDFLVEINAIAVVSGDD